MDKKHSDNFCKALETGDMNLMRKVPRADVHNHAALGGDFSSWVIKEKVDLKDNNHNFPDFTDFQRAVDLIFTYPYEKPSNSQFLERLFSLYAATYEAAIADGVTYLEPGYDSWLLDLFDMDIERMLERIESQINQFKKNITIVPDIGILRTLSNSDIERTIIPCIESGLFKAIDLYADERIGPPEDFVAVYKKARKAGLKLKAHAGELSNAEFVLKSVELLDLDEVQHGISAAGSVKVMEYLAEKGTRLNICPSSNIQLCRVDSYNKHPLRILLDNGIKVSVNTDDLMIFGHRSSDEFFSLYNTGLYSAEELNQVRLNGFPHEILKKMR